MSSAGLVAGSKMVKTSSVRLKHSTYDKMMNQVGFNHIPNLEIKTMKSVLHKANTRGHANHGWLNSHHSFSFANYYNPERTNFGVLRVLNDDVVSAGRGFGTHPHDNMEIISIPLSGSLEHKDSMGNTAVIKAGDVQVMSAGTGVYHSEYNKSQSDEVKFLQIWMFPNQKNVSPRYDQITLPQGSTNELRQVLSPDPNDEGVWVHQDAWFHIGDFVDETIVKYDLKKSGNGVYIFVLKGNLTVNKQPLDTRDGFGVWDTDQITIEAAANSRVLVMDVPMNLN